MRKRIVQATIAVILLLISLAACHKSAPIAPAPPAVNTALAQMQTQLEAIQAKLNAVDAALKVLPNTADATTLETSRQIGDRIAALNKDSQTLAQNLSSLKTQATDATAAQNQTQASFQGTLHQYRSQLSQMQSALQERNQTLGKQVVDAARSQGKAAKRPALADYVPCRFTDPDQKLLRQGYTPEQAGDPVQAVTAAAGEFSLAAANLAILTKSLKDQPDVYAAILAALKASAITHDQATKLAQVASQAEQSGEAPYDIGCSESMLTWEETRWIFGRKIADNYIAIQVTARNLNGDQEFLIHDLQVAVADFVPQTLKHRKHGSGAAPADLANCTSGCLRQNLPSTRFVAGRDRMLVRGVGQTGQQFTARNVTDRVLQAAASVLGATALVAGGPSFSPAVHVFGAAAIPGFEKVFPDLNADQIDRLNDLGFSASSAYKIVIPKNGAVPMTTFLPQTIFAEQYRNWQHCDLLNFQENMVVVLGGKHISEEASQAQLGSMDCPRTSAGFLDYSKATGDNLECQISGTGLQLLTAVRLKNADSPDDQTTLDGKASVSGKTNAGSAQFSVKALTALTGKHYLAYGESAKGEINTNSKVTLPPYAASTTPTQIHLDSSAGTECTAAGDCALTLTGTNLDLVTQARLQRTSDSTPIATAPVKATGGTSAIATFALSSLTASGLKQSTDCTVTLLAANGTEFSTSLKVTIIPKAAAATTGGK